MKVPFQKSDGQQYPVETDVCELFEMQQELRPELTAVTYNGRSLTYSELNYRASRLAARLIQNETDSPFIGISSTRNIEMIIGVLAILKAGKAYLPLDPDFPATRIIQMIREAGIKTCIC